MTEHRLFYYPYASFTNAQLPLLKVAALYFDKLVILDPVGASWGTIGADHEARRAIKMLRAENLLETVTPADVLAKYASSLTEAIRQDVQDRQFIELCETRGRGRWTLALAKVPKDLQTDQEMRHLMGDFAREMANDASSFSEQSDEYGEYAEQGQTYTETELGDDNIIEYRVADYPLALGEAIMMNHALFAGVLHTNATPITDDSFHNQALSLKLQRAAQHPSVQQIQAERARQHKVDLLAVATLTDKQLNLPILNPEMPLEEVLEYRLAHKDALQQARDKLGWMAREIKAEPWSKDFTEAIEHETIPDINKQLGEVNKARDSWLASNRTRLLTKAGTVVLGAATIGLTLCTTPFVPVAVAVAGLGLTVAKDVAIPGAEWWLDWRDGKKTVQENGLHYLLKL
jgi:hypothetical protein